jgi:hypothetical protein
MKKKRNGLREVSSKMGKIRQGAGAGGGIKKSARRSDRIGIFEHGENNGERIAHLNEDVTCFTVDGRKRGLNGY